MKTMKKRGLSVFCLVTMLLFVSACVPAGGVRSSRLFIPSGTHVTGAVTLSKGYGGAKEQMYWLAEEFQEAGLIVLTFTAADNTSVRGYERAHKDAVRLLKSDREIRDRVGRIGLVGVSMGGGAVINLGYMHDVDMVVAMAPYAPDPPGWRHRAPTMILTGTADATAPASMGEDAYNRLPGSVPRLYASIRGVSHMYWMSSGRKGSEVDFMIAWAQYYLNGDAAAYSVFANGGDNNMTGYQFDPGDGGTALR